MELDGARNAKAEAFAKAFGYGDVAVAATLSGSVAGPLFVPSEGSEAHLELVEARQQKIQRAPELIALGVLPPLGHNRDPADHGLGIFIQQKRLIDHPIVESARRISRGECRVIYTGPAVRRSAANGALYRPLQIGASIGHHRVRLQPFAKP